MWLSEKWDGTTVQATNKGVYKRRDLLERGSAKKFKTLSEEERYDVGLVNWDEPVNVHIKLATERWMERFRALEEVSRHAQSQHLNGNRRSV